MQKQEKESLDNLPCAGITLIRFYGFDLSPGKAGTPRGICASAFYEGGTKLRGNFFKTPVTFYNYSSSHSKLAHEKHVFTDPDCDHGAWNNGPGQSDQRPQR